MLCDSQRTYDVTFDYANKFHILELWSNYQFFFKMLNKFGVLTKWQKWGNRIQSCFLKHT